MRCDVWGDLLTVVFVVDVYTVVEITVVSVVPVVSSFDVFITVFGVTSVHDGPIHIVSEIDPNQYPLFDI